MSKKILIIGANSALAKDTINVLSKLHHIITAGRKNCDITYDIRHDVEIPKGVDIVINFAASYGGESDIEVRDAVDTNVIGLLNICQAVKASNVKHLINISSIFTLLNEDAKDFSIYALTKKQGDELAKFYCELNNIPFTSLRPSRIYGDSNEFQKNQPFFYQIIDKAQRGEDIVIYGDHDPIRNYIHSYDIVQLLTHVIDGSIQGIYSCAFPSNTTFSEITTVAQNAFSTKSRVVFDKDKPNVNDDEFPISENIYKVTSYTPTISISEGIHRIQTYREGNP